MSYKFDLFGDERYVRVQASFNGAHVNLNTSIEKLNLSKVIIDLRMVCRSLSDIERFYYATKIANTLKTVSIVFLMYEPLLKVVEADIPFPENVHAVPTLDEAYEWLDSGGISVLNQES